MQANEIPNVLVDRPRKVSLTDSNPFRFLVVHELCSGGDLFQAGF